MPEADLALLIEVAREAGELALTYSGPEARLWHKPDDAGPVTEADLAVNDLLASRLRTARPEYGWLSEESEDGTERLGRRRVFVIDPIDGTRSFVEGSDTWAHSIAVVEDGVPVAGVVYLPAKDRLYSAALGSGAFLNGAPITPRFATDKPEVLAARPVTEARHWKDGQVPDFRRVYRPSLAYRMALVAQGRFDGMLTLRPCWEWDVAAGEVILREAGALCTDRTGAACRFNNEVPLVPGLLAGSPTVHDGLRRALMPPSPAAP